MSPFERMAEKYRQNPQEMPFLWYVDWHFRNGFVFSTPDYFVMGRAEERRVIEGNGVEIRRYLSANLDTWYVHAMAGDIAKVWSCLPYHLPWLAFERMHAGQRRLAFVRTDRLKDLSLAYAHETFPAAATD